MSKYRILKPKVVNVTNCDWCKRVKPCVSFKMGDRDPELKLAPVTEYFLETHNLCVCCWEEFIKAVTETLNDVRLMYPLSNS